ncbi:hypothetical protein KQI84_04320 [bacterium]|nr:hypothetical protein [bacterium]
MTTSDQVLTISHSPDPDDAFAWWGVLSGRVSVPGVQFRCIPRTMQEANLACLHDEVDVAAISSAAWPHFSDRYAILGVGASVGRGYGPAVGSVNLQTLDELADATVALPGNLTTGALLFRLMHPQVRTVEMPCAKVGEAIVNGHVDAGVLIHEELMNLRHRGMRRLECLGKSWEQETGLPIPVGLIAVRQSLGDDLIEHIAHAVRESVEVALQNREAAVAFAMTYTHQAADGIGEEFIEMFTNSDTVELPEDCREALRLLFAKAYTADLIPSLPAVRPVYPAEVRHAFAG